MEGKCALIQGTARKTQLLQVVAVTCDAWRRQVTRSALVCFVRVRVGGPRSCVFLFVCVCVHSF